jgi:hypothetical protein
MMRQRSSSNDSARRTGAPSNGAPRQFAATATTSSQSSRSVWPRRSQQPPRRKQPRRLIRPSTLCYRFARGNGRQLRVSCTPTSGRRTWPRDASRCRRTAAWLAQEPSPSPEYRSGSAPSRFLGTVKISRYCQDFSVLSSIVGTVKISRYCQDFEASPFHGIALYVQRFRQLGDSSREAQR